MKSKIKGRKEKEGMRIEEEKKIIKREKEKRKR